MKKKANVKCRRLQVRDELHSMHRSQFFGRFGFDHHAVVDGHVEPLPGNS
jgi:hypothetical protein